MSHNTLKRHTAMTHQVMKFWIILLEINLYLTMRFQAWRELTKIHAILKIAKSTFNITGKQGKPQAIKLEGKVTL